VAPAVRAIATGRQTLRHGRGERAGDAPRSGAESEARTRAGWCGRRAEHAVAIRATGSTGPVGIWIASFERARAAVAEEDGWSATPQAGDVRDTRGLVRCYWTIAVARADQVLEEEVG